MATLRLALFARITPSTQQPLYNLNSSYNAHIPLSSLIFIAEYINILLIRLITIAILTKRMSNAKLLLKRTIYIYLYQYKRQTARRIMKMKSNLIAVFLVACCVKSGSSYCEQLSWCVLTPEAVQAQAAADATTEPAVQFERRVTTCCC